MQSKLENNDRWVLEEKWGFPPKEN
jgi:hypothetical protein